MAANRDDTKGQRSGKSGAAGSKGGGSGASRKPLTDAEAAALYPRAFRFVTFRHNGNALKAVQELLNEAKNKRDVLGGKVKDVDGVNQTLVEENEDLRANLRSLEEELEQSHQFEGAEAEALEKLVGRYGSLAAVVRVADEHVTFAAENRSLKDEKRMVDVPKAGVNAGAFKLLVEGRKLAWEVKEQDVPTGQKKPDGTDETTKRQEIFVKPEADEKAQFVALREYANKNLPAEVSTALFTPPQQGNGSHAATGGTPNAFGGAGNQTPNADGNNRVGVPWTGGQGAGDRTGGSGDLVGDFLGQRNAPQLTPQTLFNRPQAPSQGQGPGQPGPGQR